MRDLSGPRRDFEKPNRGGTFFTVVVVAARLVSSSFAGQLGLDLAWRLHSQTRRGLDIAASLASRVPFSTPRALRRRASSSVDATPLGVESLDEKKHT